jgi:threonine/homoserine/homoserine lactone efflux protein
MMQPPRQSDCYVVFGSSAALAGFPVAFSAEREQALRWVAVHVLVWFVAIAWRRQGTAEGDAA